MECLGFVLLNAETYTDLLHGFYLSEVGTGGWQWQEVALIFCDCSILKLGSDDPALCGSRDVSLQLLPAEFNRPARLVCLNCN